VTLHEVLADPANTDRGVVFWSEADSRSKMIEYIQRCACANRV
jgi:hypothetical protein